MDRLPRSIGKCRELLNGKECGGNLMEKFKERGKIGSFFFGHSELVGYQCDNENCKKEHQLVDPFDTIRSLSR